MVKFDNERKTRKNKRFEGGLSKMLNEDYSKEYSDKSFWDKVKKYAKAAGLKVVYVALLLYYTLEDPDVPKKAKGIIIGALGYFILPIDLVPDAIAGLGYGDDFSLLFWALLQVAMHVRPAIKAKAREQLVNWFGEFDFDQIREIDKKLDEDDFQVDTAK